MQLPCVDDPVVPSGAEGDAVTPENAEEDSPAAADGDDGMPRTLGPAPELWDVRHTRPRDRFDILLELLASDTRAAVAGRSILAKLAKRASSVSGGDGASSSAARRPLSTPWLRLQRGLPWHEDAAVRWLAGQVLGRQRKGGPSWRGDAAVDAPILSAVRCCLVANAASRQQQEEEAEGSTQPTTRRTPGVPLLEVTAFVARLVSDRLSKLNLNFDARGVPVRPTIRASNVALLLSGYSHLFALRDCRTDRPVAATALLPPLVASEAQLTAAETLVSNVQVYFPARLRVCHRLKTRRCFFASQAAGCKSGSRCPFAHTDAELLLPPQVVERIARFTSSAAGGTDDRADINQNRDSADDAWKAPLQAVVDAWRNDGDEHREGDDGDDEGLVGDDDDNNANNGIVVGSKDGNCDEKKQRNAHDVPARNATRGKTGQEMVARASDLCDRFYRMTNLPLWLLRWGRAHAGDLWSLCDGVGVAVPWGTRLQWTATRERSVRPSTVASVSREPLVACDWSIATVGSGALRRCTVHAVRHVAADTVAQVRRVLLVARDANAAESAWVEYLAAVTSVVWQQTAQLCSEQRETAMFAANGAGGRSQRRRRQQQGRRRATWSAEGPSLPWIRVRQLRHALRSAGLSAPCTVSSESVSLPEVLEALPWLELQPQCNDDGAGSKGSGAASDDGRGEAGACVRWKWRQRRIRAISVEMMRGIARRWTHCDTTDEGPATGRETSPLPYGSSDSATGAELHHAATNRTGRSMPAVPSSPPPAFPSSSSSQGRSRPLSATQAATTEESSADADMVVEVGGGHQSVRLGSSQRRRADDISDRCFWYDEVVPFSEDEEHEFKAGLGGGVRRAIPKMAPRYIVSFLNGRGGTLYFGIRNDGIVQGLHLSRDDRDAVNLSVDTIKHRRIGPAGSWLFVGNPVFVPVYVRRRRDGRGGVAVGAGPEPSRFRAGVGLGGRRDADDLQWQYWEVPDTFVIEIPVYPSHNPSNLHFEIQTVARDGVLSQQRTNDATHATDILEWYWVRHAASTRRMTSPQEMAEWGFHRGKAHTLATAMGGSPQPQLGPRVTDEGATAAPPVTARDSEQQHSTAHRDQSNGGRDAWETSATGLQDATQSYASKGALPVHIPGRAYSLRGVVSRGGRHAGREDDDHRDGGRSERVEGDSGHVRRNERSRSRGNSSAETPALAVRLPPSGQGDSNAEDMQSSEWSSLSLGAVDGAGATSAPATTTTTTTTTAAATPREMSPTSPSSSPVPHFEEVEVELGSEEAIAMQGPGAMGLGGFGNDWVLEVKLAQVPIRNSVSLVVTSIRRGCMLDVVGLVSPGALLLKVNGVSLEKLRGSALRRLLSPGKARRLLFFTPVQQKATDDDRPTGGQFHVVAERGAGVAPREWRASRGSGGAGLSWFRFWTGR